MSKWSLLCKSLSNGVHVYQNAVYTFTNCRIVHFITPHFTSTYEEKLLEALDPITD